MLQDRVNRGIALLDELMPDWRDKINLDNLDMGDCKNCILGQLYGYFEEGLDKLEIWGSNDWYAFNVFEYVNFNELTEAWKQTLKGDK